MGKRKRGMSALDLFNQRNRSIPKRIRMLEREQRATSANTRTKSNGAALSPSVPVTRKPDTAVRPTSITDGDVTRTSDGSVAPTLIRPNLLINSSLEYKQEGETNCHGWTGCTQYLPTTFPTMNGFAVGEVATTASALTATSIEGPGAFVASVWVYQPVGAEEAFLHLNFNVTPDELPDEYIIARSPDSGGVWQITENGPINSNIVPQGVWTRFYQCTTVNYSGTCQLTVELAWGDPVYIDAAKIELEVGDTGFIEPTSYMPDDYSMVTLIPNLRADNIKTGTLTIGGPSLAPAQLEIRDTSGTLIVLGDVDGVKIYEDAGLEVVGSGSIKVSGTGKIEAGSTVLEEDGLTIYTDTTFSFDKALKFVNPVTGVYAGLIYGDSPGVSTDRIAFGGDPDFILGYGYHSVIQSWDGTNGTLSVDSGYTGSGVYSVGRHYQEKSPTATTAKYTHTTNAYSTQSATGTLEFNSYRSGTTTTLTGRVGSEGNSGANFKGMKFYGTNNNGSYSGYAELIGVTAVDGFTKTWPTVNGTITHGAGTISGSSTSNANLSDHTHLVDAYSNPGTTQDRLVKTGVAGAVTLADFTATVFKIGATPRTLVANASGTIALGAATVTTTSLNAVTGTDHSHAIDVTTTGVANKIVATDANGDIVASRMLSAAKGAKKNMGTSFPASPIQGQEFYRTDLGYNFVYTGSRWETENITAGPISPRKLTPYANSDVSFSATAFAVGTIAIDNRNLGIEIQTTSYVALQNSGAADSASNYWNHYVEFQNTGSASVATVIGNADQTQATANKTSALTSANSWTSKNLTTAVSLAQNSNGARAIFFVEKIGSPTSNLEVVAHIEYKLIG